MKPTKSILDPTFRYMSSAQTDLRKTFARVRREQRELAAKIEEEQKNKVTIFNPEQLRPRKFHNPVKG